MRSPLLPARLSVPVIAIAVVPGCLHSPPRSGPPLPAAVSPIRLRDVAEERGLRFRFSDGDPAQRTIVQMTAGGAAFLDVDGDGNLDALLIGMSRLALYRNDGRGSFRDVTAGSGLSTNPGWMGCAAGDYDNDGRVDLLLAGFHCARLYHNEGGRFRDVTSVRGLRDDRFYTSAAFADVDNDGRLDLYLGAYVEFGPDSPRYCTAGVDRNGQAVRRPCGPEPYRPQKGRLYLNRGSHRFVDATLASGLGGATGKTLGVAFADYDGDGREDLYLANDRTPCDLFHNVGVRGGVPRFRNVARESGTAFDRNGEAQSGMGVDWGDYDNDGRLDLIVANYQNEPKSLYHNDGGGLFRNVSAAAGLAPAIPYVGFGTRFVDLDNDGWQDLFLVNGHVLGPMEAIDPMLSYPQPMQCFRNRETGRFEYLPGALVGPAARRIVGRAAAFGDFDNDGRCDVLVADLDGSPLLLRNESETGGRGLRIRLEGRRSNRQGIGAWVTVRAGTRRQTREVSAGGSYLAASDPRLHVGLGSAEGVDAVDVRWPSGERSTARPTAGAREMVIREP